MAYSFAALKQGYTDNLRRMIITRQSVIDATAKKLVALYKAGKYGDVPQRTGIPAAWIAASFEREASSNFSRSPAQGDPWSRISVHVPRGRGPFRSWEASALDAYHINGLDKIGAGHWTWELCCYYGEIFNGMGYRGHGIPSPYLWGGSNIQKRGKYVSDGVYNANVMDTQLGIIPLIKRMIELEPSLDFTRSQILTTPPAVIPDAPPAERAPPPPPKEIHPTAGLLAGTLAAIAAWAHDHWWVIALCVVAAIVTVALLYRKPSPPLSPKAIDPPTQE